MTGEEEESDPPSNEDSIEEFTSIEDSGKESSLCDISGVSAFQRESISTSSTDWMGPGPMPMDDSVEVFYGTWSLKSIEYSKNNCFYGQCHCFLLVNIGF